MEYAMYIGGGILVLVVLLLLFISTRPKHFLIERSKIVAGSPAGAFAIVNDLRRFRLWSPFERDPNMKVTYDGPETGVGSSYAWEGNNKVGAGKMTITESQVGTLVAMNLEFLRPFKCNNRVRFTMVPESGGTRVAWIMEGENNFFAKAFSLLMNMDRMLGKDFEAGLNNLDRVIREAAGKTG